jgi:hypothetical protein
VRFAINGRRSTGVVDGTRKFKQNNARGFTISPKAVSALAPRRGKTNEKTLRRFATTQSEERGWSRVVGGHRNAVSVPAIIRSPRRRHFEVSHTYGRQIKIISELEAKRLSGNRPRWNMFTYVLMRGALRKYPSRSFVTKRPRDARRRKYKFLAQDDHMRFASTTDPNVSQ